MICPHCQYENTEYGEKIVRGEHGDFFWSNRKFRRKDIKGRYETTDVTYAFACPKCRIIFIDQE